MNEEKFDSSRYVKIFEELYEGQLRASADRGIALLKGKLSKTTAASDAYDYLKKIDGLTSYINANLERLLVGQSSHKFLPVRAFRVKYHGYASFSEAIGDFRKQAKLSSSRLAAYSRISPRTLLAWGHGKRASRRDAVTKLLNVFDIDPPEKRQELEMLALHS